MRTDARSNCSPISFLWWGGATQSQSLDGKGRRDKDDWFEEVRRLLSILTTLATVQCSAVCHLDFGEDQPFHIFYCPFHKHSVRCFISHPTQIYPSYSIPIPSTFNITVLCIVRKKWEPRFPLFFFSKFQKFRTTTGGKLEKYW